MLANKKTYNMQPQFVDYRGFTTFSEKQAKYHELNNKKNKLSLAVNGHVSLYRAPTYFFMLDHNRQELLFYLKYQRHTVNGKSCVTQLEIWREKASLATAGVTQIVFWDYLAKEFDAVVSDQDQSVFGKSFWELRAAESFARGYKVSFLNMSTKVALVCSDEEQFRDNLHRFYGEDEKFRLWRLVISKGEFPSK
jgi:hypothetical protein